MKEESKRVTTMVSKECLRQLKIFSLEKDISLQQAINFILEKEMVKKNKKQNEEVVQQ